MDQIERLVPLILTIINGLWLVWQAAKKNKPEVKKLDAEARQEDVEAENLILEGAAKSQQLLIDRINELQNQLNEERTARKSDLAAEREARRIELENEKTARKAEIEAEKEARRREADYLRRRIKEAEREARDYRQWAAKLVKQVVEAGKVPAPFIPTSLEDSDPSIPAITDSSKGEK